MNRPATESLTGGVKPVFTSLNSPGAHGVSGAFLGRRGTAATYAKMTSPDAPMLVTASPGLFPDSEPLEWRWASEE